MARECILYDVRDPEIKQLRLTAAEGGTALCPERNGLLAQGGSIAIGLDLVQAATDAAMGQYFDC
jgi:hypothetical protein